MSKKQREALWDRLATLLRGTMADFPPDRWNAEDRDDAMEVEVPPDLVSSIVGHALCRTQLDWKVPVLHHNVHAVPFKHNHIVSNKES